MAVKKDGFAHRDGANREEGNRFQTWCRVLS